MRSTSGAELNGPVDRIEQLLSLQTTLHQAYCGTHPSPEEMIDLLEHGGLYPSSDVAVDARAVFDAVAAADACDPQGCSLKLHLISVREPRNNQADALGRYTGHISGWSNQRWG